MPQPSHTSDQAGVVIERWRDLFLAAAEQSEIREEFRAAAVAGSLSKWTSLLTATVVSACRASGWVAAAKGHRLEHLPQAGHEYLGLDVMAFAAEQAPSPWTMPVAVFELENSADDVRVAYSLWKVACIRSPIAVVFAYRPDWEQAAELVRTLSGQVPRELAQNGQTLVLAIGSRGQSEGFPWGFFRFYRFTPTLNGFSKF